MNFLDYLKSREQDYFSGSPLIMGILNVTPDSFSDGGKFVKGEFVDVDAAVNRAIQMMSEGADIIDIGGESSGPGSKDVSLEEELARLIPVIKNLKLKIKDLEKAGKHQQKNFISVDTYKAEVARQALEAGADMINDVTALRGGLDRANGQAGVSKMAAVLAEYPNVPVVIMYSKDATARTTRDNVQYDDVTKTVRKFLEDKVEAGVAAGIARERFIIDPGMGAFVSGDPKYSLEILRRLKEFSNVNLPILIGASRKGFIGQVLGGLPADQRLEGSLACAAIAMQNGAKILRVHDVKETRRFVDMLASIEKF